MEVVASLLTGSAWGRSRWKLFDPPFGLPVATGTLQLTRSGRWRSTDPQHYPAQLASSSKRTLTAPSLRGARYRRGWWNRRAAVLAGSRGKGDIWYAWVMRLDEVPTAAAAATEQACSAAETCGEVDVEKGGETKEWQRLPGRAAAPAPLQVGLSHDKKKQVCGLFAQEAR
jgi:hypothetical protein